MAILPLNDLTVLEFSHTVMGPSCGVVLADLGADVIRVEPAPDGDRTRRLHGFATGFFAYFNRNKRCICIDVKAPDGGEAPPGTRGAVGAEIGTLLVAAGRAAIGPVVAAIQSWVARRASRSVKLTIDGDSIEVSNVSPEDQRELIQSFLARHAPE